MHILNAYYQFEKYYLGAFWTTWTSRTIWRSGRHQLCHDCHCPDMFYYDAGFMLCWLDLVKLWINTKQLVLGNYLELVFWVMIGHCALIMAKTNYTRSLGLLLMYDICSLDECSLLLATLCSQRTITPKTTLTNSERSSYEQESRYLHKYMGNIK